MSKLGRLPLLALAVALGCDSSVEPQQQQDLWAAQGIKNYTYDYSVGCFCAFNGPNPARITVRNGVVVSVTSTDASVTPFTGPLGPFPTIDSLFAIAERGKASKPAAFNIAYDDKYHFPRMIFIDPVQRVTDDEVTYRAESFTPATSQ